MNFITACHLKFSRKEHCMVSFSRISVLGVLLGVLTIPGNLRAQAQASSTPENNGCLMPLSTSIVEQLLAEIPPQLVTFQHEAARRRLEALGSDLPCLDTPLSPALLARFWQLDTLAAVYQADEKGTLEGATRALLVTAFARVRQLDPSLVWDEAQLGPQGRELWNEAASVLLPGRALDNPAPTQPPIWIDGQRWGQQTGAQISVGKHLVQVQEESLRGAWLDMEAAESPWAPPLPTRAPVIPVAVAEKAPLLEPKPAAPPAEIPSNPQVSVEEKTLRPRVGIGLQAWTMPLLQLGPSLDLSLPMEPHVRVGLELGAGFRHAESGTRLVVPLGLELRTPLFVGPGELEVGLGYLGYVGQGFQKAYAGDTTPEDAGWQLSDGRWSHASSTTAHGAVLDLRYHLRVGALYVTARVGGGLIRWPDAFVSPQLTAGIGISRPGVRS
jgi:hypothetical protein